ncbi:hypothetical protein AVEN_61970-1 [Araneus ventricosus]|uniref:Uncharacterized protein n=1 Tax=Araneus ventricosus TaxID=182803 RepID=A0A4Y2SNX7_ARAVE|nr:hypothetical protein AVEN_61970-1 [Araneus ventricosus]
MPYFDAVATEDYFGRDLFILNHDQLTRTTSVAAVPLQPPHRTSERLILHQAYISKSGLKPAPLRFRSRKSTEALRNQQISNNMLYRFEKNLTET